MSLVQEFTSVANKPGARVAPDTPKQEACQCARRNCETVERPRTESGVKNQTTQRRLEAAFRDTSGLQRLTRPADIRSDIRLAKKPQPPTSMFTDSRDSEASERVKPQCEAKSEK